MSDAESTVISYTEAEIRETIAEIVAKYPRLPEIYRDSDCGSCCFAEDAADVYGPEARRVADAYVMWRWLLGEE